MSVPEKLFITGTDTGVGKTVTAAVLTAGLGCEYWKPVQSGLTGETDTAVVRRLTGLPDDYFHPETWSLTQPLSPHAAAEHDGVFIDPADFIPPITAHNRGLIVEGAGGIMVPLNERHFMLDLMKLLNYPIILVARSTLGTINHTLLSLEQLGRHDLTVAGVVLNGPLNPVNREAIGHYGRVRILAEIEPFPVLDGLALKRAFNRFNFN